MKLKSAIKKALGRGLISCAISTFAIQASASDTSILDLDQPPPAPEELAYNEISEEAIAVETPIIRTYKDFNAWWGENRDHATLIASPLAKTLGTDYFIHPMNALPFIPAATDVVLMTSNSRGWTSTRRMQNDPTAQAMLALFLSTSGVVIVDMGDNDYEGGFVAPGSTGTPDYVFPSPCNNATLAPAALGPDGILGTSDDHPMVIGPDGIVGTADDLNDSNIDLSYSCYIAHGNLVDGITLPPDTKVLMTARFGGVEKPILAEYCYGPGLVIVDTLTKEFSGQNPGGTGPSRFMTNLFDYALNKSDASCCELVDIDIKPGSYPNSINLGSAGVIPVAVFSTDDFNAPEEIDPSTVTLAGAQVKAVGNEGKLLCHSEDVNEDGLADLVCQVETDQLLLEEGDTMAELEANTFDGRCVRGEDSVNIVP
ncbi:MAG: hypothetical protein ABFS56_21415 [Pseudomonadota bacterium]